MTFYGVRRLALHLDWSINRTRRIRNLGGVVVPTASKRRRYRPEQPAQTKAPANLLANYATPKDPDNPQSGYDYAPMTQTGAWAADFTYLRIRGGFCYLAVVMDLASRRVVGWQLSTSHSADLVAEALLDALSRHSPPTILHSDQGSEYLSFRYQELCQKLGISLSCSAAGKPWQNGFVERWFGQFKLELGPTRQLKDVAELHEAVALAIHYCNTKRIHLALKTTPAAYALIMHKVSTKKELDTQKRMANKTIQKPAGLTTVLTHNGQLL